ncbi:MAG: TrmJ/YjtD family RNA methyltransferase [Chloroflexales bacterium]|nr:TrmJ/YjtD family RNA methyltransferase [Chloroflexales bacterium]
MLDQIVVVLHRPRAVVNIGGVVRAMKNMGLRQLRLVDPVPFTAYAITGIAHRSDDVLDAARIFDTLDAALPDLSFAVGTTARPRQAHAAQADIRALAPDLLARAAAGPVGLLFGPEDNGLDNAALDRCNIVVSLPTDPAYASLNLAQAALLLMYELRMAAIAPPLLAAREAPPTVEQRERLFAALDRSLSEIEFFKGGRDESIMRSLRGLLYRADPDAREAGLLTAMAYEVLNFARRLRRSGSE